MPIRKIIEIDEERCTGCGLCVVDCAEGALEIIDGKAKVVNDVFCDGLGACIGACPEDALKIVEREAVDFDEEAVEAHLVGKQGDAPVAPEPAACGCPGSMTRLFDEPCGAPAAPVSQAPRAAAVSELRQWPIQLRLLPPSGPLYQDKDVMLIADCVAAANPEVQQQLVRGNTIIMTCPKLDDPDPSIMKLAQIVQNPVRSIGVAIMEVPCCTGLLHILREAMARAGVSKPIQVLRYAIRGELLERYEIPGQ